jgi:glutathione synthase/RimK-type ligase-like ATP-grasp enzyme
LIVIGNPENRRVAMFQGALVAQVDHLPALIRGNPTPARVVAWIDLVEPGAPARLLAGEPLIRIDSFGENDAVERALLLRGEAAARTDGVPAISAAELAALPYELGKIVHPRQLHLGFLAVLAEIEAATAGARVLPPPSAIRELFDKVAASERWRALGIPMADPLRLVHTPDEVRAAMRERGWPTVFVKLTSGSSASCLAMFTSNDAGEHVLTTVEDTGRARFNTRKLQRLTTRDRIDRVLGFILGEGAIVERAIPKAKLDGAWFDLRVLAIDGEAAFVVMRTSPHPITNLHLGGLRGDVDALRARIAPAAWDAAMASAVAVQRATGAFHVGVDLMFEPDLVHHRVLEGNAFGDLLPNLERDGLDVYGWQIRRLLGTVRG